MTTDHVKASLMAAINRMRLACEDAERHAGKGDARAIRLVLHDFAWGWANAVGEIDDAMSIQEEDRSAVQSN